MDARVITFIKIGLACSIGAFLIAAPVMALGESGAQGGIEAARGAGAPGNLANGDGSIVQRVINIMLWVVGVLSVIMLIVGGVRYIISGGQKDSVTAAKNTILYAIIGLLVAVFAYAIIRFVLSAALGASGSTDV